MAQKTTKTESKLVMGWGALRNVLEQGDPRRILAGRFQGEKKMIQTARNSPQRHQRVKRRQRVVMARKKRITNAVKAAVKLFLFGTALVCVGANVFHHLNTSPTFAISHIAVSGNTHVTAREVIAQSGIGEGMNIFQVSLAETAASIGRIPWVDKARIERALPDEVHIEITERIPVAVAVSDELLYIDSEGKVLAQFDPSDSICAPLITAKALAGLKPGDTLGVEGIDRALELIRIASEKNVPPELGLAEINIDDPSNIIMVAEQSGASVFLGSGEDLEDKLWRLIKIAEAISENERLRIVNLERVDMRFDSIVPAKFKGT
ncbi:FtsQ-type POTRA domain-containing protein [Candidatus Poribacteria bacterium]|nr:FtsQ-type POTRA domain-containing protein [Candidatus Poribacteria bacterium]